MKTVFCFLIYFLLSSCSHAQALFSSTSLHEPGDKLSYSLKTGGANKIIQIEYVFTEVSESELIGYQIRDGKVMPVKTAQYGIATYDMCWDVGQNCIFDPPMRLFDRNIKLADQWVNRFKVTAEDFVSNVTQEVKVIKQEKVSLKFGDFDAYKIEMKSKFNGTTSKGQSFNGTDAAEFWVAAVDNKMTLVKMNYSNSFKDKFSAELDSQPTKSK
jgi:hypothetical protein